MRKLRLLRFHPRPSQVRVPLRSCSLRSSAPHVVPSAWATYSTAPAPSTSQGKTRDLPGSWGTPCTHAPLFDPGGPLAPHPLVTSDAAFRSENHVGSTIRFISRLNHAAYLLPVYASQPSSRLHHATLGSGWWLPFAGSGLPPDGLLQEYSVTSSLYMTFLLQASPGALSAETKTLRVAAQLFPSDSGCLGNNAPIATESV